MEINGTEIPVGVTFFIRDAKAYRDNGNIPAMERSLDKIRKSGLPEDVVEVLIHKATHDPYRPNPHKAPSGCVMPNYSGRTYTATKVQDPVGKAWLALNQAILDGTVGEDEATPMAQHLLAKEATAKQAARAAKVQALKDAILAL